MRIPQNFSKNRWILPTPEYNQPGLYMVNPGWRGIGTAQLTYADLTRSKWQDYLARFQGAEKELAGSIGNQEMLDEQLGLIDTAVNDSFSQQREIRDRNINRLGTSLNEEERAVSDRLSNMNRAAAIVDAKNNARIHAQDRDNALLTSG